ncbi:MAG TPA: transposase [Steroidobacteraceae bacterium]
MAKGQNGRAGLIVACAAATPIGRPRMARKPRVHVPGGFYHVTLRGNHRQDIFQTSADRALMESLVADASRTVGASIHAYCWMTNHIHLLVEVGTAPLGALMQRIAGPYARDVHRRFETTGHLFERRHFARLVRSESSLLAVIRYTHFNPVRAGLVDRLADYPWSSHHAYLGTVQYPWLTTDYALAMLASTDEAAREAYRQYVSAADAATLPSPFEDRASGESGADLNRAPAACNRRDSGTNAAAPRSLEGLIGEVCAARGVSVTDAVSQDRARHLNDVRAEIARRAVADGLATLSQVSSALGRSVAALGQAVRRRK